MWRWSSGCRHARRKLIGAFARSLMVSVGAACNLLIERRGCIPSIDLTSSRRIIHYGNTTIALASALTRLYLSRPVPARAPTLPPVPCKLAWRETRAGARSGGPPEQQWRGRRSRMKGGVCGSGRPSGVRWAACCSEDRASAGCLRPSARPSVAGGGLAICR